ncbi:MAG: hypothetical protein ABI611_09010 [Solirubrobacteraceae bacterium]
MEGFLVSEIRSSREYGSKVDEIIGGSLENERSADDRGAQQLALGEF